MKNIAVVAGGYSSEYPISVQSGSMLVKEISKTGYKTYLVEICPEGWFVHHQGEKISIDRSDFSFFLNEKIKFDAVVMAIHGTPGEDGKLQGYFDLLQIPYTCCGVMAASITFNKYACKIFASHLGIDTAQAMLIRKGYDFKFSDILSKVGLPCFVKPNESGSSFGVSKITDQNQLEEAINLAFTESNEIIVEQYISGTEVTCGMISFPEGDIVFPITEVVSKREFFDYQAKYTSGLSEEITPARIDETMAAKVRSYTQKLYHALGCKGITRTDFILSNQRAYLLEVNTVPGMSPNSIVPQQLKAMGVSVGELYYRIIQNICT